MSFTFSVSVRSPSTGPIGFMQLHGLYPLFGIIGQDRCLSFWTQFGLLFSGTCISSFYTLPGASVVFNNGFRLGSNSCHGLYYMLMCIIITPSNDIPSCLFSVPLLQRVPVFLLIFQYLLTYPSSLSP